ncbi:MAG: DUF58 domain-containing protein [Microcoleaceae cyanobacterium]
MFLYRKLIHWLETHWVTPAYAGGLLGFLAIFFFGAATNTMAGWLYVISGISLALLGLAAILPARSLSALQVSRRAIDPVSQGYQLTVELEIENPTAQPKTLLQVRDQLPANLGKAATTIEILPPQSQHRWMYTLPTQKRGVYHWPGVELRTATPLGLFWCTRFRAAKATAIVYPTVFPLNRCPLVDDLGENYSPQASDRYRFKMAQEGLTRTLRPYRYGDPTRLIHWRTSARYGELRVRELEVSRGGEEIIIALDSAAPWPEEAFEQAVTVAASLYFYVSRAQLNGQLWTAGTGLVHGNRVVLATLAGVTAAEARSVEGLPAVPVIWITSNRASLPSLPSGSRWVLWPSSEPSEQQQKRVRQQPVSQGIDIVPDRPLELQLQAPLNR